MAGYPNPEEKVALEEEVAHLDEGGWILADPDTVSSATPTSSINAELLSVNMALAFPKLPKVPTKIDAVLSVLAPTSQGTSRAPLRLVAVLDKSGSMQGEKILLVIETVKFMLQHLTERDALGLIAFDSAVSMLAPLTLCNSEGRAHLESVISRVKAGSQTNLSGGLLRGLELHKEGLCNRVSSSRAPLQRISFGNKYRRLSEAVEAPERKPPPAGCERVHEWTMELLTETSDAAALIKKVVYKLHTTFEDPEVEVLEPPFLLTRVGWGHFKIHADVHLHDGRVLPLEHELCFHKSEQFRTILLPLQSAAQDMPSALKSEDDQAVVRSTFLFTDGVANVGITDSEQLCNAIAAMSTELEGAECTISTFGFGKDHTEDLLRNIANHSKGVYCFIENADTIGEAFGEALGGLLSVTHQNVRMSLELAPGVSLVKARTKYPVEGPLCNENGSQSLSIDVGDLFAEERRDILLELSLPEMSADDGMEKFGSFHARAFSVLGTRSETTKSVDLVVERLHDIDAPQGDADPQVERHRNRYIASEALGEARTTAKRGDLAEARKILQSASAELTASASAVQGCPLTLALLVDLQDCLRDLQNDQTYTCSGSKKMAYMEIAHQRQRTCGGATTAMYCNSTGLAMKSLGAQIKSKPSTS